MKQDDDPEEAKTSDAEESINAPEERTEGQLGDSEQVNVDGKSPKHPDKIKRLLHGYFRHKKWTLPLTLLLILAAVAAVPQTRYPILALGLKRNYSVTVMDSKAETPVSGASVTLDGKTVTTDSAGKASFTARVGKRNLTISKQYYKNTSQSVFVGIMTAHNAVSVELAATGRQVPIKIVNKITGKPVSNAEIKVLDTEAKTDANGMATIVLPTDSTEQSATITASGYNNLATKVQVTEKVLAANTFAITPAGRIYFLSNLNGNIDVVSANLDGSGRKTVLAGTGNEDENNTVLLASRDWRYLALLSNRDGGKYAKLYLITTSSNKLTTMDEGTATFNPVGWSNHSFVYQVTRSNVNPWQSGQNALKSYNADTAKIAAVDQSSAQGGQGNFISQSISFVSIINDRVIYGLSWTAYYGSYSVNLSGKHNSIMSANADGTNKKDLRDITIASGITYTWMQSLVSKPETLYIQTSMGSQPNVYYTYNYENNTVTQSNTMTDDTFSKALQNQKTYLASPSNKQTFWTEFRDGKNTLFVGDYEGNNGMQIASLSNYSPYGWFTDDYLLVQKSGSELYVLPATGGTALKISDYYKPPRSFYGYGGGYGGI